MPSLGVWFVCSSAFRRHKTVRGHAWFYGTGVVQRRPAWKVLVEANTASQGSLFGALSRYERTL